MVKTYRPDLKKKKLTFVYFSRGLTSGLIKIGFSHDPEGRATDLRHDVGEDVQVLMTTPGNRVQEKGYHKRFAEYRVRGEWFYEAGRLHEFLKGRGYGGTKTVIEKQVKFEIEPTRVVEVLKHRAGPGNERVPLAIGYARVSTDDQNVSVQLEDLRRSGVHEENIYVEKISAVNAKRPQFHLMMKFLEPGDTLYVHSLSRLGRDVKQIHAIVDDLAAREILWRSITESHLNNATAVGRLMLNVTGAMAQFERDQIKERTKRGMDECKRKGMYLGRAKKFDAKQAAAIQKDRKTMTAKQCAEKWNCSTGTIDKYAPTSRAKKAA